MQKRLIYIDLETHLFGPGNMAPKPVCMSFDAGEGGHLVPWWTGEAEEILKECLRSAARGEVVLAAHKASYDFSCILNHASHLGPLIFAAYAADGITCSRTREKLLDIAEGKLRGSYNDQGEWIDSDYRLNVLSQRYFDFEMDKGADGYRTRYSELDGVPIEQWPQRAIDYAIEDAVYGRKLILHQKDRAAGLGYSMPTEFLEARACFSLQLMQCWGIHTDGPKVHALWEKTEARMLELRRLLLDAELMVPKRKKDATALAKYGLEGNSPEEILFRKDMKAIRDRIEGYWPEGIGPIPRSPKTQQLKTGKDILEMCDHPGLQGLIEFNSLQKSGSTYVKKMFEGIEHPIHANFDVLGASSSRTSCRGPNLQNQPRLPGVRECFITRQGRVFLACDFNSQEMRTLAQTCLDIVGKSKLAERYQKNPNFDPHQDFADSHGGERQHCKIANFGIPGGMGAGGLMRYAKGYGETWTHRFATEIRKSYFLQWPEMNDYFRHVRSLVGDANFGYMTIPQSGFKRGGVGYTDCANGYFQGLAAAASKNALFEVVRRCYDVTMNSWLYQSRPVLFIHDEVVTETPEEVGHEAAMEMERVMAEGMAKYVPDVPPMAEATLMTYWSKKAKRVFDNGRLVAWNGQQKAAA